MAMHSLINDDYMFQYIIHIIYKIYLQVRIYMMQYIKYTSTHAVENLYKYGIITLTVILQTPSWTVFETFFCILHKISLTLYGSAEGPREVFKNNLRIA